MCASLSRGDTTDIISRSPSKLPDILWEQPKPETFGDSQKMPSNMDTLMRLIYWNYEQITPPGSTVRTVSSLSLYASVNF